MITILFLEKKPGPTAMQTNESYVNASELTLYTQVTDNPAYQSRNELKITHIHMW